MVADVWNPDFLARSYWLWPLRAAGCGLSVLSEFPEHARLDAIYARCSGDQAVRLRFVQDASKIPNRTKCRRTADERYDGQIVIRHEVPTRACNWHDVLNALCFSTFPRAKWALHCRQYRALRQLDPGTDQRWPAARTREQDALTIFDEGGVVVAVSAAEVAHDFLNNGDVEQLRDLVTGGHARVVPFGHALLEHFVAERGRPGGGARIVFVNAQLDSDAALIREIDQCIASMIDDDTQFLSPQDGFGRIYLTEDWQSP